ncbi:hypothetical protein Q5O89_16890 [Peribacillus frigoritolerans]|nr:hypothetical protein [Peribacillus frigoritolerans]
MRKLLILWKRHCEFKYPPQQTSDVKVENKIGDNERVSIDALGDFLKNKLIMK